MEPIIQGVKYQILPSIAGGWVIKSAPYGTYSLFLRDDGQWKWTSSYSGQPYRFGSKEEAEAAARALSGEKPPMTPEERKARLIACGWED